MIEGVPPDLAICENRDLTDRVCLSPFRDEVGGWTTATVFGAPHDPANPKILDSMARSTLPPYPYGVIRYRDVAGAGQMFRCCAMANPPRVCGAPSDARHSGGGARDALVADEERDSTNGVPAPEPTPLGAAGGHFPHGSPRNSKMSMGSPASSVSTPATSLLVNTAPVSRFVWWRRRSGPAHCRVCPRTTCLPKSWLAKRKGSRIQTLITLNQCRWCC